MFLRLFSQVVSVLCFLFFSNTHFWFGETWLVNIARSAEQNTKCKVLGATYEKTKMCLQCFVFYISLKIIKIFQTYQTY